MEIRSKRKTTVMGNPLKIGIVSPYDYSAFGGVNDHISNLAEQFLISGHDVKILAPNSHQSGVDKNVISLGGVIPIPSGGAIAKVSLSIWLRSKIQALLEEEQFDIVHLHEPFAGAITMNILSVLPSVKTKAFATFHTLDGTPLYKIGTRIGAKGIALRYFNRIDGRIAVSKPCESFITKYFPGKYEIIPNGVNIKQFQKAKPYQKFKDDKVNILFVGRLEKRKGFRYLLGAYSSLKWTHPQTRLLVVGSSEPDAYSQRMISERNIKDVVFVGGISDSAKARFYKTADIFCSPATGRESFGIVLLEAMASNCPIIASNIPGYASVISHGIDGHLIKPKHETSINNALVKLIDDPKYRESLVNNASETVLNYDWSNISNRILDYYKCKMG